MAIIQFQPDIILNSVLAPGWRLEFVDSGTMLPATVYADGGGTVEHIQPVTLDRFGQLPAIYVDDATGYEVAASNEYGVFRYQQAFPGPASSTAGVAVVQPEQSSNFTIPAPDNDQRAVVVPTNSSGGAFTLTPASSGWQGGDTLIVIDSPGTSWAANAVALDIQGGGHNYHEDSSTTISITGGGIKRYVYVNPTTGFADGIPP